MLLTSQIGILLLLLSRKPNKDIDLIMVGSILIVSITKARGYNSSIYAYDELTGYTCSALCCATHIEKN